MMGMYEITDDCKINIFDKINNYMRINMVKQVIFCSLDSKLWTVQHKMLNGDIQSKLVVVHQKEDVND